MELQIDTNKGKETIVIDSDMDRNFKTVYTAELKSNTFLSATGESVEEAIKKIQDKLNSQSSHR